MRANALESQGESHGTPAVSDSPAAPLSDTAALLLEVLADRADSTHPMTQLRAGRSVGFIGTDDSIRRRVQKIRDEVNGQGRSFIVSSWSKSHPGMWIAETPEQIQEYADHCIGRALTTLERFRSAERSIRLRIAQQVQGVLDLGDAPEVRRGANQSRFQGVSGAER